MKLSVILTLATCLLAMPRHGVAQPSGARFTALSFSEAWVDTVRNGGPDVGLYVASQDTVTLNASVVIPGLSGISADQWQNLVVGISLAGFSQSSPVLNGTALSATKEIFPIGAFDANGNHVIIGSVTLTRTGDTLSFLVQSKNPASGDPSPASIAADLYFGQPGLIHDQINCEITVASTMLDRTVYVTGTDKETTDANQNTLDTVAISGAADFTAPTVSIVSPRAGSQVTNATVTVQARASDNFGVANVNFSLDGGGTVPATADPVVAALWSAPFDLTPGPHTLTAQSFDADANASVPATVRFTYIVVAPVTLLTNGYGRITGATNGQALQLGSVYSLTALPAAGFVFTNWSGSFETNKPRLTFVMDSNVTLQASFVDVAKPTVAIAAPLSGVFTTNNNQLLVRGTANDNAQVATVLLSLNGGDFQAGAGTTSWTAILPLQPGTNFVVVKSVDSSGLESLSITNRYVFVPAAHLTLVTNGVAPGNRITLVPAGPMQVLGKVYTATATAGPNQIFSNWFGGVIPAFSLLGTNPAYPFIMQSNLVLQANFVTNVFRTAQGSYYGLFITTNDARNNSNSGAFNLLVTTSGTFTGKLPIGPDAPSLAGRFDVSGHAHFTATRVGKPLLVIDLQLDLDHQKVHGSVTDTNGSFMASLDGFQAYYSATRKAPFAGQYTFMLPAVGDASVGPFGFSAGTVKVDVLGNVTLGGNLADGTVINQTSVVSQDGFWPCYLPLYGGRGSLWSWNQFAGQAIYAVGSNAAMSWINTTNPAVTARYRSGFTNDTVYFYTSAYASTNQPLLGFTNGVVILQGGNLPFSITNHIVVAANNTVSAPDALEKTNKLALLINKAAGTVTGSFANPVKPAQLIPLNGAVLQNGTNVWGYFLGTNQSGVFTISPQ